MQTSSKLQIGHQNLIIGFRNGPCSDGACPELSALDQKLLMFLGKHVHSNELTDMECTRIGVELQNWRSLNSITSLSSATTTNNLPPNGLLKLVSF